jgi:hypothetical protein
MEKETIKNILDFLEKKENKKHKDSDNLVWKLRFGYPLTKEELNQKGNLHLSFTKITSLPKGLKVGGFLYLFMCKHLTSLPEGLKVGGILSLNHSSITSLPKGLEVGGDLQIEGASLTKYSNEELRKMIEPGFIKGDIIR